MDTLESLNGQICKLFLMNQEPRSHFKIWILGKAFSSTIVLGWWVLGAAYVFALLVFGVLCLQAKNNIISLHFSLTHMYIINILHLHFGTLLSFIYLFLHSCFQLPFYSLFIFLLNQSVNIRNFSCFLWAASFV